MPNGPGSFQNRKPMYSPLAPAPQLMAMPQTGVAVSWVGRGGRVGRDWEE